MGRTKMIEDSRLAQPRFKGMAHGVRTIVAEEGYRGLYRGVGPVVRI
jgi:solute carrier family 25 citrate transporter 1